MKKGFSIITNFGCDEGCRYCIWKQHELRDIYTSYVSTDWQLLFDYLNENKIKKLSVSGGGDPLYKLEENKLWWAKLFRICQRLQIDIDLHTAKIITDYLFLENFNKIVIHFNADKFNNISLIKRYTNKIRIVFVVDGSYDIGEICKYAGHCIKHDYQLSFRELCGKKNEKIQNIENYIIKNQRKLKCKFIEQADYNHYFMPNNEIVDTYLVKEYGSKAK